MKFIDAHCHLCARELLEHEEEIMKEAKSVGVRGFNVVSENVDDFDEVLALSKRHSGVCFPCLGVHPVQPGPRSVTNDDIQAALPRLECHKDEIVAVGEVGLDYTPWICKSDEDKQNQLSVFVKQINLSLSYGIPLNIHSRSSAKYVVQILKDMDVKHALLHNFAGRSSVAMEAVRLGYFMSFPPIIARKPERDKLIKMLPLDNLLLETDSPALGIVDNVPNQPRNIVHSCSHIAKVKGLPEDIVAEAAWKNTLTLFPRIRDKILLADTG